MEKIDTGTEHLIFEKENGVAVLTMNRPEARNAMSGEMNEAMRATLEEVELDPTIRCVVLTGAGKGFCAGGDVVKLRKEVLADGGPPTDLSRSFFYDEYTLNYKISKI